VKPFKSIVARFPDREAIANDLGVKEITVRQWGNRNSIPSSYWTKLVELAPKHGVDLSLDELASIAATPSKADAA
jgi:hypothetical protein